MIDKCGSWITHPGLQVPWYDLNRWVMSMRDDVPQLDRLPSPLADPDVAGPMQRLELEMELSRLDAGG